MQFCCTDAMDVTGVYDSGLTLATHRLPGETCTPRSSTDTDGKPQNENLRDRGQVPGAKFRGQVPGAEACGACRSRKITGEWPALLKVFGPSKLRGEDGVAMHRHDIAPWTDALFEAHCKRESHELGKGSGERKLPGQQIIASSHGTNPHFCGRTDFLTVFKSFIGMVTIKNSCDTACR